MTEWYYRDAQSRKIGPLSTDEFEERVTAGEIHGQTPVWHSGLLDWITYDALLAHEANVVMVASGPAASAAPQSRSQSTSVAHRASTPHRPSRVSVTPAATLHPATGPAFELCAGCHEEMPSRLFRPVGRRRICGNCLRAGRGGNSAPRRPGDPRAVDARWLGKFLVRLALVAGAVVAIRVLVMEMGGSPAPAPMRPALEDVLPIPSASANAGSLPGDPGSVPAR